MSKLRLGISPCPNDTFIFDALIHHKIDTKGLEFEVSYEDVESLNQKAFQEQFDICKISYHAYLYLIETYQLLHAGSALGKGVGPLLVAKQEFSNTDLAKCRVAIPGKYTTANFLFSIAYPEVKEKVEMEFSEIEEAVIQGRVDAGIIIHEGRFTYADSGLTKLMDLGDYWEKTTQDLIPLGGIAVQRNMEESLKQKINEVLKSSVEFAFANRHSSKEFVKAHAQEMEEEVIRQHIDLYVNKYSLDLGEKGRKAIYRMQEEAARTHLIAENNKPLFV